jgi:adenylate cyclase
VERLGRWLWERHAPRIVGGLAALGSFYLGFSRSEAIGWWAAIVLVSAGGLGVISRGLRRWTGPIRAWVDGDRTDPSAAWTALVQLPNRFGIGVIAVFLPLHLGTTFLLALHLSDGSGPAVAGLVLAYALVIAAAAVLTATLAQLLVRAAATQVGMAVEGFDGRLTGRWTMRRRLVAATFVASTLALVAGPVVVLGTAATPRHYLIALVGGALLSAYLAWLFDVGLFTPTLTPVQDLIEGARRVQRGDLASVVPVSSLDELGDLALAFNAMQSGLRERAALQAAFGSYVDPLLAQRLLDSGTSVFEGEELEVTVLFLDVRGFTSYSEGVAPAEAVALLNRLFDVVVPVVHEHGGHANHYLGDGLLAVFGAPQPLPAHADAAMAAAIEVQRRVQAQLGEEVRIGIGVNTGPVIAGTVGGGGRHEFTVIGDTVNVAARVEQLTKETGDLILITEATRTALSSPRPRTARRGDVEVRGKTAKVRLHAINPFTRSTRSGRR